MSFIREMANVGVTLGSYAIAKPGIEMIWKEPSITRSVLKGTVPITGAYFANKYMSEKSPDEVKNLIRDRAITKLQSMGINEAQALEAFEQHYEQGPVSKPGFFRTIGNIISTRVMAGVGIYASTMLASAVGLKFENRKERAIKNLLTDFDFGTNDGTQKIAKKAVVIFGALTGGYFGNKFLQGVSSKTYDTQANDVVTKILANRRPEGAEMSQLEALKYRDAQRSQSTERKF